MEEVCSGRLSCIKIIATEPLFYFVLYEELGKVFKNQMSGLYIGRNSSYRPDSDTLSGDFYFLEQLLSRLFL